MHTDQKTCILLSIDVAYQHYFGAFMTDAEKIQLLKDYQLWRLGDDKIAHPKPKDITEALDYAIRCCVRLDFIARDNPKVEHQALECEVLKLKIATLEESASRFGIRMKEIKDTLRDKEAKITDLEASILSMQRFLVVDDD